MAEEQIPELSTETAALEDVTEASDEKLYVSRLVDIVNERFTKAETSRRQHEEQWLRNYKNYRGVYSESVKFTEAEKSRVFIKVTKTKVLAAYGQITDVLFSAGRFPLSVDPTVLPEGIVGDVHYDPMDSEQSGEEESPYGFDGDGRDLPAGATESSLKLGPMEAKLEGKDLKEGMGSSPTSVNYNPAMLAAKRMEKKIHDQLDESEATKQLRSAAFEMPLFGTGIMKGPMAVDKEYPDWDAEGNYIPVTKTVPKVSYVSVWDFYPDPDAASITDCQYSIQRHKMNRSQLRDLKRRPFFRKDVIEDVITQGESYAKKYWEDDLQDYQTDSGVDRFEVLEYWGVMDMKTIEEHDIEIPEELESADELQVNIWICNDRVIRSVLNPFKPVRLPYYAVPYEHNPYSLFGIGLAENMDDTQTLMNGFMRMAVDNAVLSGNLIFEVDETNLVPGQDMQLYPGKVFRRQGGAPGQALFGTKYPNVSGENLQLFDKARQLADESTGLPSFSHGQTGVSGVGRTSSGISMLMNAAAGGIKTVIKNIDDYMLGPMGKNFFHFNMQFDFDKSIRGDLEVKARGTESLMANEVRSQRLMQFLQVGANPNLAPWMKSQYIIREIAKSMELDPDKVTNNIEEAQEQAMVMQKQQAEAQAQAGPAQGAPQPSDPTGAGNGNIGIGQVPTPDEQGFSGNEPQAPQPTMQ
jgi:hypothetical protein